MWNRNYPTQLSTRITVAIEANNSSTGDGILISTADATSNNGILWKQGSQNYEGRTANEGMTVKKMSGATGDGLVDLSLAEFWENTGNFGDMEVLAQNHGAAKGWVDNANSTND